MSDPYIRQIPGREYLVSVGTAFPLHNIGTTINASIEYGHRGTADLLQENDVRFTLNVSVGENWFFKRRLWFGTMFASDNFDNKTEEK